MSCIMCRRDTKNLHDVKSSHAVYYVYSASELTFLQNVTKLETFIKADHFKINLPLPVVLAQHQWLL